MSIYVLLLIILRAAQESNLLVEVKPPCARLEEGPYGALLTLV
jgi:hypothetical protein